MVKRNKRQKGLFGIDDAILIPAAISAISSIGSSLFNSKRQRDAAQASIDAQNAVAQQNANAEAAATMQSNLYNIANNRQEEQNRILSTQTSALKLGGRRCKCKGGLMKFI